jgi:hypothetical protein
MPRTVRQHDTTTTEDKERGGRGHDTGRGQREGEDTAARPQQRRSTEKEGDTAQGEGGLNYQSELRRPECREGHAGAGNGLHGQASARGIGAPYPELTARQFKAVHGLKSHLGRFGLCSNRHATPRRAMSHETHVSHAPSASQPLRRPYLHIR